MRSRLVWALVVLLLVCAGSRLEPGSARADGPTAVVFTEVGEHPFIVPAGVTTIHVVAVGAPGGNGERSPGGLGAQATADLPVTPGQTLNVVVGGEGASTTPAPGGFNGGGDGNSAGGGGGASDVRSGGPGAFSTRLIVAGGGGGGGSGQGESAGGNAGQAGEPIGSSCAGGGGATPTAAGKGGKGGSSGKAGGAGSLGLGGDAPEGAGAGGGGGFYGGGAGGGYIDGGNAEFFFCGGGGGSSGFGPGARATSVTVAATRIPSVTITYTAPPAPPSTPAAPTNPGTGAGVGPSSGSESAKAALTIPAVEHGKAIVAAVKIPANRSSLKAKLLWQKSKKKKPLVFGKLVEAGLKKGLHSFTVDLNGSGRAKLDKLGKLKLTLAVKVIPPQGAVATAMKKVTLKP